MLRRLAPAAAAAAILGGTLVLAPSATAQPLESPQPRDSGLHGALVDARGAVQ